MKKLTEDFNQTAVSKGDSFKIELPTSPSTGYAWDIKVTSGQARQLKQEFNPPRTTMTGGKISDIRTFVVEGDDTVEVEATYKSFTGVIGKSVKFEIKVL